jgi:hypothetical protein
LHCGPLCIRGNSTTYRSLPTYDSSARILELTASIPNVVLAIKSSKERYCTKYLHQVSRDDPFNLFFFAPVHTLLKMKFNIVSALGAIVFSSFVSAQLSGGVGPSTTTASKAAKKVCNILNYGGVASKATDNAPAIASAWAACKSGGEGNSPIYLYLYPIF